MKIFNVLKNIGRSLHAFKGELVKTYSSNTYVNSTSFDRMSFYQYGDFCIAYINLQITTTLPSNATFVKIGTVTFPRTVSPTVSLTMASQSGAGNILFTIEGDGSVQVFNGSGTNATGFYRAPIIFSIGAK